MFIKKLNKIYAPQPNSASSKKPPLNDSYSTKPLKITMISMDPHCNLLSLYSEQSDTIYIVSILSILQYMDKYRKQYCETGGRHYSHKSGLIPQLMIQNSKLTLHIFDISFSYSLQNTQFIVVTYFSGELVMYSVNSGKKIDSVDITQKKHQDQHKEYNKKQYNQGSDSKIVTNNNKNTQSSPIFNVNVIGHSIFISLYDGTLLCYEGRELGKCLKFQGEWVRLGYGTIVEQDSRDNIKKSKTNTNRTKRVPIYVDTDKNIKLGNSIITSLNMQTKRQSSRLSSSKLETSSMIQYRKLQKQKITATGSFRDCGLSPCQRYLIWKGHDGLKVDSCLLSQISFQISLRQNNWNKIKDVEFGSWPYINQFWGIQYKAGQQKKQCTNFIQFVMKSADIVLAVIEDYNFPLSAPITSVNNSQSGTIQQHIQNQSSITNLRSISIIKLKFKHTKQPSTICQYEPIIICKMVDAKYNIVDLCWIGPTILLYLDDHANLYYMEVDQQLFMDI